MKIVRTKYIPNGYKYITFASWMFARPNAIISDKDYNHESIHERQYYELLIIFFLIWYVFEFLIRFVCNGFQWKKAYRSISFEREAYENDDNLSYLNERKHYAWLKYI